jgi:HAD superfamily hydrolase (TIGR01509 family)
VPVSVLSCGFQEFFPPSKIHSGESDFDPPRFKPDPSVYLLAAEKENALPVNCIAVEDSTSGVGGVVQVDTRVEFVWFLCLKL